MPQRIGGPDPLRFRTDVRTEAPWSGPIATRDASIVPCRIVETGSHPAGWRAIVTKLLALPMIACEDRLATVVDRCKERSAVGWPGSEVVGIDGIDRRSVTRGGEGEALCLSPILCGSDLLFVHVEVVAVVDRDVDLAGGGVEVMVDVAAVVVAQLAGSSSTVTREAPVLLGRTDTYRSKLRHGGTVDDAPLTGGNCELFLDMSKDISRNLDSTCSISPFSRLSSLLTLRLARPGLGDEVGGVT